MTLPQPRSNTPFSPFQVVLIVIVLAVVAGGSLLLSAPETTQLMEGAIEWHEESILRAVVRLLCLNYEFPTHHPDTVKGYLLGLGAGIALLVLAIRVWTDRPSEAENVINGGSAARPGAHVPPRTAVPLMLALFLLWSFASSRWSSAPDLSWGASLQAAIPWLWAFLLGATLERRGVRLVCRACVAISGAASLTAIWYFYGRNPGLRAMFPFGNPTFLSACLLPGLLLCVTTCFESLGRIRGRARSSDRAIAVGCVVVAALCLWALVLTRSRGALVGLAFGILALVFLVLRGRWRWGPVVVGASCLVVGVLYAERAAATVAPTGRDTTLRFRPYAWSYAWELFRGRPLTGLGQGGFVLHGDALSVDDVLEDPAVFETRIEHAHNEWLETLCDLGSVGFVLLAALFVFTFVASDRMLALADDVGDYWSGVGLLAGLAALVMEESFGVGLRVAGVATWFFTVLGLLWALSRVDRHALTATLVLSSGRRIVSGVIGTGVSLVVLVLVQADWTASRNAFDAQTALESGRFDEATRLASNAANAMNPQRSLSNLHRLAEVQLAIARARQAQGLDRAQRALSLEPVDFRLLELALRDFQVADDACRFGNHALKELISRSPGFIHQGTTEYWLNIVQAQTAEAYSRIREQVSAGPLRDRVPVVDAMDVDRFVENASKALQRELRRQPFDPELAVAFARTAGPSTTAREILESLARPLRLHSVTQEYAQLLSNLMRETSFEPDFAPLAEEARTALRSPLPSGAAETWAPEKLRLWAASRFLRGEYEAARQDLVLTVEGYGRLSRPVLMGQASAWAELADANFFAAPSFPSKADSAASKAVDTAPQSGRGRQLVQAVRSRQVEYALAGGDEERAKAILQAMDPSIAPAAIASEIDDRVRRLAESFVRRWESAGSDWLSPELADRLGHWVRRSNEVGPNDPDAKFLSARWALVRREGETAAAELRRALERGLSPELAVRFLDHADLILPGNGALQEIRESITKVPAALPPEP